MSNRAKKLLEEALLLTEREQIELANRILDTVQRNGDDDDPSFDPSVEAEWAAEIKLRVDEMASGKVKGIPWEKVRREVEEKLNAKTGRRSSPRSKSRNPSSSGLVRKSK